MERKPDDILWIIRNADRVWAYPTRTRALRTLSWMTPAERATLHNTGTVEIREFSQPIHVQKITRADLAGSGWSVQHDETSQG